jgi:hypothetical protein
VTGTTQFFAPPSLFLPNRLIELGARRFHGGRWVRAWKCMMRETEVQIADPKLMEKFHETKRRRSASEQEIIVERPAETSVPKRLSTSRLSYSRCQFACLTARVRRRDVRIQFGAHKLFSLEEE